MPQDQEHLRYGIDLGGTKVEIVALTAKGFEVTRQRVPTPQGDYAATVRTIADLVSQTQQTYGPGSVGIGIPGTISPQTGLVKNANSTCLIGQPLGEDLRAAIGQPVKVANDADCLALSEATDGAAAGAAVAFAVILGTGVGGGLIANGHILTGPNAIGGEWGHNPLPWPQDSERPGPSCYCGKSGCIETFLSGPALAASHIDPDLSPAAIAEAASQGDPASQQTLARYCDRLARALASVINILDPEVIVLGGGLSNLPILYETVPTLWTPWVFSDTVLTPLRPALHGDSSGVRGAACLWDTTRVRSVD
jgi:fructokinase